MYREVAESLTARNAFRSEVSGCLLFWLTETDVSFRRQYDGQPLELFWPLSNLTADLMICNRMSLFQVSDISHPVHPLYCILNILSM